MKKAKKIMKVMIIILIVFLVGLIAIHISHRIKLNKEEGLKTPLGILVEVDGHQMSVYVEGNGNKTIVFMSGGGTCSPILDFRSLFSTLSDNYKIVVVEKFGYGFSDVVDKERSIDSILEDTRPETWARTGCPSAASPGGRRHSAEPSPSNPAAKALPVSFLACFFFSLIRA